MSHNEKLLPSAHTAKVANTQEINFYEVQLIYSPSIWKQGLKSGIQNLGPRRHSNELSFRDILKKVNTKILGYSIGNIRSGGHF